MTRTRRDPIAEIRQLYFRATPATILDDFDRAIDLLKTVTDERARERASVYMEGLAELRREFKPRGREPRRRPRRS